MFVFQQFEKNEQWAYFTMYNGATEKSRCPRLFTRKFHELEFQDFGNGS